MIVIGTLYNIRNNEVSVQPGLLLAGLGGIGVCKLISAVTPTVVAAVYIEAQIGKSFGVMTASPTIYYKPAGCDTASQVESLPAEIEAALSNLR